MIKESLDLKTFSEFSRFDLLAKQLVEGFVTGLHKSPFHGFSVEFAEHKQYNNGESTRHIDWKLYNKTDKLYVKRYDEETNLRCHILVDHSSSMYYPKDGHDKIKFAALGAGSLAYMLQKQRDAVGLSTFNNEVTYHSQIKSTPTHVKNLMVELQKLLHEVPKNKETGIADTLHSLAPKIHKRSLIVIFSDFFDDFENTEAIFNALQHLAHNKNEIIIFHVSHRKTEKDFEFKNRPHEFIDLETGDSVHLQPAQIKEYYTTKMAEHYNNLKLRCGQLKIDFVEVDTDQGFTPIFLEFLQKRKRMSR